MIPADECVRGHLYRLRSRNLVLGVFDGREGFVGLRYKFDDEPFLFTEYHYDRGAPFGTARPEEALGPCPVKDLRESLGTQCVCGRPCHYDESEGPYFSERLDREYPGRWRHLDGDLSYMTDGHHAAPVHNDELRAWLRPLDDQELARRRAEWDDQVEGDH